MPKKIEKKVVKKVAVVKPKVEKVVEPIELVVEPKEVKCTLKCESYLNVKILDISKREDGAYDVKLADGTSTILDEAQYKQDVK